MVICPIARAVHCTGCIFFKFCPAKSSLGDYEEAIAEPVVNVEEKQIPGAEAKDDDGSAN